MTTQNKELFQKFVEFCDAQPKDVEINHKRYFSDCAIGDYAKSIGEDFSGYPRWSLFAKEILGDGELYNIVDRAFTFSELRTYGGYTALLKTYL
jgi:hypothetical protein